MRSIAKFLGIALICTSVSSHAAVKNLQEVDFFQAEMEVDSVHTSDAGNTFQASFSGKAGSYGRVYLSYDFTNKQQLADMGEFTGFAWAQNGETVVTATLQGSWVKVGTIFKLYSIDSVSNGKLNLAVGEIDFVAKTLRFDVSELKH
jgi:hypothetical protein